jgi:MFS family permease
VHSRRKLPYVVAMGALARGLYLLMLWVTHTPGYIAVAAAALMIEPMFFPAYATVMKDVYPDRCRGRLMGYVRAGVVLTTMGGAMLAGSLMPLVGYRLLFPLAALMGVLSSLNFSRIGTVETPEPPATHQSLLRSFDVFKEDRVFRLFVQGVSIFGSGSMLAAPIVPLMQVDVLHITEAWVGILATVTAAISLLAYYAWGRLMDRYDPMVTLLWALVVATGYRVVFIFVQDVPTLLVASVCAGIGFSGFDLSWINWVMRFTPRDRIAQYTGVHFFIAGLRGITLPFLAVALLRWLPDTGLHPMRAVFVIATLLNLTGLVFTLRAARKAKAYAHLAHQ